jgi:hypothetical protein
MPHTICPSCRTRQAFSEGPAGKSQCPACGHTFTLDEPNAFASRDVPDSIPDSTDEDFAEDPGDALTAPQGPRLSPHQAKVHVYLVNGLNYYRKRARRWLYLVGLGSFPLIVPLAAAVALSMMFALYAVLLALGWFLGPWTSYGLYLAPLVALAVGLLMRPDSNAGWVSLSRRAGGDGSFAIGRFEHFSNPAVPRTYSLVFGMVFGFQMGLHYWTLNHGGLEIEGGFWQCLLLTLDNVCQGVFLDTFDLYDLRFAGTVEHTYFSATIFWVFRLAYVALVALLLWDAWRRRSVEIMFVDWPQDSPGPDRVAWWAEGTFGCKSGWTRLFLDECLFLLLAAQFLRGNYDHAREIARQFSWLRVAPDVRELFLDADGKALFETAAAV